MLIKEVCYGQEDPADQKRRRGSEQTKNKKDNSQKRNVHNPKEKVKQGSTSGNPIDGGQ